MGLNTRKHRDWLGENCTEIRQLLKEKRCAYKAHHDNPKSEAKKDKQECTEQGKLRQMQDSWLRSGAGEIQGFAARNDMHFYYSLKEIYGSTTSGSLSPLLNADESKLVSKEKVFERWIEHYNGVLNKPSTINDAM